MRRRDALFAAVLVSACASACEDESLAEIHPRIFVCPAGDSVEADCNRPLDLGERFLTVEHEVTLFVKNRGEAPLGVADVRSDADWLSVHPSSLVVDVNSEEAVTVTFTPEALGEQEVTLTFASDDPNQRSLALPLRLVGTPKPEPMLELCLLDVSPPLCGVGLDVDFGVVRRTQRETRTIAVRNVGTDVLVIEDVVVSDRSSQPAEIYVATSTRGGTLGPGDEAQVALFYEPVDGEDDELGLTFLTNAAGAEQARVNVRAQSEHNRPPVALAEELYSGLGSIEVTVGDVVTLDGAASRDFEGDPLRYEWTLTVPAGSTAELDDPEAGRVSFSPDVTGAYRAELLVRDSLDQVSEVPSVVLVQALPDAALRVRLSWTQGGDVDLHFAPTGDDLFGSTDTHFGNPRPDLGVAADPVDDPELLTDAESAPGAENIIYVAPAPGTYRIYVHYYDEGGAGAALTRLTLTLNDASFPVLDDTRTLSAGCALWHVADVQFPGGLVSNTGAGISSVCP